MVTLLLDTLLVGINGLGMNESPLKPVAAKHIEMKKFYILYNQLEDTRLQMERELKLLNSIMDSFDM